MGFKFHRQMPVGPCVADFCCVEKRLIVDLDGGQHIERARYDEKRTRDLAKKGDRVIRFWDRDVLKERVLEEILRGLGTLPSPPPSPACGRGGTIQKLAHGGRNEPREDYNQENRSSHFHRSPCKDMLLHIAREL